MLAKYRGLLACIGVVICINGRCVVETAPEIGSMEYLCAEVFDALRHGAPCGYRQVKDKTASTQLALSFGSH